MFILFEVELLELAYRCYYIQKILTYSMYLWIFSPYVLCDSQLHVRLPYIDPKDIFFPTPFFSMLPFG